MRMNSVKTAARALSGGWVEGLDGFGDFRIKLKSVKAPAAQNYFNRMLKEVLGARELRRLKVIPTEITDYCWAKTFIDVCVEDWANWEGEDGKPVAYSKETLVDHLLAPAAGGIEIKSQGGKARYYTTPDGKAFNYAYAPLLEALNQASNLVESPDEEDAAEDVKKRSPAGSPGSAAKPMETGSPD